MYIALPPLRDRRGDIPSLVGHFLEKLGRSLGKQISSVSESVMARFLSYSWPGNVRELEHVLEGALNMAWDQDLITADHLRSHFYTGPESRIPKQADVLEPQHPGHDGSAAAILPALPPPPAGRPNGAGDMLPEGQTLVQTQQARELQAIRQAMARQRGNVTRAAAKLGISRQLLHYKLRKYAIDRRQFLS